MQPITHVFSPILTGNARPDALRGYPVVHVQPVAWGDMDAFDHVNNVAYYRYAESARISYFRQIGLTKNRSDLLTILASSSCQYLAPVSFPDTLLIGVRVKHIGNTSLVFEYEFVSFIQNKTVARGEAVIVRTDQSMQKTAWSCEERALFEKFENRQFAKS